MLPKSLALVDDDLEFSEFLAQFLQHRDVGVRVFPDSNDLLTDRAPYDFGFYVLDLALPGVDGLELIRILRRRTSVGILVISGRLASDVFESAITAGADMYLAKPVSFEQVAVAIRAVHRRAMASQEHASVWKLDRHNGELMAPDGARIELSSNDLAVMECFADAGGEIVTRAALRERLGRASSEDSDNVLHATIYRLRRRIEKATPSLVPLQTQSRVGYVFKGKLIRS